jgi:hypothetical protein
MKNEISKILFIFLLTLSINACDNGGGNDIPIYSFRDPIVNPPAIFNIVYNLNLIGDQVASIQFEQNAVWKIDKLGDGKANLYLSHNEQKRWINTSDTVALYADSLYGVVVNNNNYTDLGNYFIGFTKLDLDYATFEPKF